HSGSLDTVSPRRSVRSDAHGSSEGPTMTRRKLMIPALAATASATAFCLPAAAHADPVGPCAEVPFVGVCVPISQQPYPPIQQNREDVVLPPHTGSDIHVVN